MMHRLAVTLSVLVLATMASVSAADPLDAVFGHIDAAAKTFKGMTADISNTQHTSLVDSDDIQTGIIKLLRVKGGQTRLLIDWKGAGGNQKLAFDGREGKMYNPKTNIVDTRGIGDKENIVNQLLLLGFGATSAELKDTYDVTYIGEEKIGSQQTTHLKLIPKSAETRHTLKQADLWYAGNGLVAQQKFLYPSGDYRLVTFSNLKLGPLQEKDLELKLPKNAIIQKH